MARERGKGREEKEDGKRVGGDGRSGKRGRGKVRRETGKGKLTAKQERGDVIRGE